MTRTSCLKLLTASGLLLAAGLAAAAPNLRVMLAPGQAERPWPELQIQLQLPGPAPMTTRTGALELEVANPAEIAARLRRDRTVLWAQPVATATAAALRVPSKRAMLEAPSARLLLQLRDGVTLDEALPGLAQRIGSSLTLVRSLGATVVVALPAALSPVALAEVAAALEQDPRVRFADPAVIRFRPTAKTPNDPLYPLQWGMRGGPAGSRTDIAWERQLGSINIAVAVIDTGILPHPDLDHRVLPGYDFISDAARARDGNPRDPNPLDQGDWTEDGACGGYAGAEDSSWHGTFVSGIIAATGDNDLGVAGVNWRSPILPVRVLGECGGTDEDVIAGSLWAAGLPVPGVPLNPTPAKVLNLSLGGYGSCPQAMQAAIDQILAQGSVVVVAAGNESMDVGSFAPANCNGVISVAALTIGGERAFYSNFGAGITLAAPAGDTREDATVSTSNDGAKTPEAPSYAAGVGTSFAAPFVSGAASLMLAQNALLTPGRVQDLLEATTRSFVPGSTCAVGFCGVGMLDTGAAVAATALASLDPPAGAVTVVEYYDAALDHYFLTTNSSEQLSLDLVSKVHQRTGAVFYAWASAGTAPPGAVPVCRFVSWNPLIRSHFFSPEASDCAYLAAHGQPDWQLETMEAFYVQLPDAAGACPADRMAIYRFDNNRNDFNQRHTADLTVRRAMLNRAWVPTGTRGPLERGVAFCAPL